MLRGQAFPPCRTRKMPAQSHVALLIGPLLLFLGHDRFRLAGLDQKENGQQADVGQHGTKRQSLPARNLDTGYGPPRVLGTLRDLVDFAEIEYSHRFEVMFSGETVRTHAAHPVEDLFRNPQDRNTVGARDPGRASLHNRRDKRLRLSTQGLAFGIA